MELPTSSRGARATATTTDSSPTVAQNGYYTAQTSAVSQSPRIPSESPRMGGWGAGHHRKDSVPSPFLDKAPSTAGSFISAFFGGTGVSHGAAKDGRPGAGGGIGSTLGLGIPTLSSYGGAGRSTGRAFYSPRNDSRRATPLQLVLGIVLRPLYLVGRRGPLLPLVFTIALLLVFLTYSTSPSSQTVKLKMQGAVGPYIPLRAAAAVHWRGRAGRTELDDDGEMVDDVTGTRSQKPFVPNKARKGRLPKAQGVSPATSLKLPPPRRDGRLLLKEGEPHPIPALMARAKKQWKELKAKQSKTFAQAVAEYEKRYGRKPPKGFDKWYAFAKAHKVLLIDEFDLIDKDLLMYRAFKPENLRARVAYLPKWLSFLWEVTIQNGKSIPGGELRDHNRAKGVEYLMSRFAHELPNMTIVYNGQDGARIAVTAEERARLEGLAKRGEYDQDDGEPYYPKEFGPDPHHSMPIFCPPGSAVRDEGFDYGWPSMESTGYEMPEQVPGSIGTLLDSFKSYMDVCNSPQYRHFHCTTSWVYPHHPTQVVPLFTPGVQTTFGDVHALIVEQLELESQHDPTWEERPFTSLQWRGQTSGPLWEKTSPWRTTQRARLHLLSHQEEGSRNVTLTDDQDRIRIEEIPNYRLNPLFLDVGMVGPAVQCVQEDGTCDEMYEVFQGYDKRISFDRASLYKFVLDVDGNSWSGRFRRLMLSNAAVIKATIFTEFWTDWAVPWLHFIPMQVDYSDMWDILAFFRGGINGEGAHDALGKSIADAGKQWVKQCYRWADLEAYQFRLMLEYARLYNDETSPGSNDFNGDTSSEPIWKGEVRLQ